MHNNLPITFYSILYYLSVLSIVAASVIGLANSRQIFYNLRALAVLTYFEAPLEIFSVSLILNHKSNLFLMPIYTVGELALLALLYHRTLESSAFSRWIPWAVGGFTIYTILDSLLGPGLHWFRPWQQIIQSLLILVMVGLYFLKLLNELRVKHLTHEPMFWVSTGLLTYFLGYLQIALFSNYLLQNYSVQFNRNVWAVHTLLSIVLHSCYCLALWMRPKK